MDIDNIKKALQLRDRAVRVISKDGHYRAVCVKNTTTALTAQKNHKLDAIPAILLARTLAGASLASAFLKGEERIVLQIDCDGAVSKIFAEAMQLGEVRGFIDLKNPGSKIEGDNIADIIGNGLFRLSRVLYNEAEPVQGVVPLQKGDISTDLAFYYNQSEQVPSAVIMDCTTDSNGFIRQSGGLIVQAMPGYSDDELFNIFDSLVNAKPLSRYFDEELNPQQCLKNILPFEFDILSSTQVDFFCRCSMETFKSKLLTLGKKEINEMQQVGHNELVCRYCSKHYYLTDEDFISLNQELIARNN